MYCGCNEKALGSQRAIACAMLKLLEEESYEAISICALCRLAGVSRPTFYSLFGSKDDVVLYLLHESFRIEPEPSALTQLEGMCRGFSRCFSEQRRFLGLLAENGIGHLLYQSIFHSLTDCACFLPDAEEMPRRYAAHFTAGALTGVVYNYVNQPCTEEELGSILEELFDGSMFLTR